MKLEEQISEKSRLARARKKAGNLGMHISKRPGGYALRYDHAPTRPVVGAGHSASIDVIEQYLKALWEKFDG